MQSSNQNNTFESQESYLTTENDNKNYGTSRHEQITQEYLKKTKLEGILLNAVKDVISGDLLPKNPYCNLTRSVVLSNMKEQLSQNFEQLSRAYRKNAVDREGPYQITQIGSQFKVFGLRHILELVDLKFLQALINSIDEILPDLKFDENEIQIQVSNSISGGIIFQSDLISYASSHPKELEIFTEVFIKAGDLQTALEHFSNFVYSDVTGVVNIEDMHIIKEFILYSYSEEKGSKNIKKGWQVDEILRNRNEFINDIQTYAKNKNPIYWKGYLKIERLNYNNQEDQDDDYHSSRPDSNYQRKRGSKSNSKYQEELFSQNRVKQYQYIEVYKVYNLHFTNSTNQKQAQSFQNVPLGSLMKGIFINHDVSMQYASFFYKKDESYKNSEFYTSFAQNQLKLVLKKWQEQNILACSWELLYMALIIEEPDLRRNLVDNILQILTSDLSALAAISKTNNILQYILKLYERTGNVQILRPVIQYTFGVLKDGIQLELSKTSNIDLIRYKDYLGVLLKEAVDKENQLIIGERAMAILTTIHRITKYISLGNLQQVGSLNRNVPDFIYHTLTRNNLLSEGDLEFLTYDEFNQRKHKSKVLHLSQYLLQLKRQAEFQSKSPVELENSLILNYLSYYDIYDNIQKFLQNLLFGQQIPNPFAKITAQFESKALRYSIYDKPMSEIAESFLTQVREVDRVGNAGMGQFNDMQIKGKTDGSLQADIYQIQNHDMKQAGINPVYGVLEIISVAGNMELGTRKQFMDTIHWKQSLKRQLPAGYIVSDMLTVQVFDIFAHPLLLANNYIQWDFSWDFLIKGKSEEYARQIYMDIIIRYSQWVEENSPSAAILGFYANDEQVLSIEEILYNAETAESRNILGKVIESGDTIILRLLLKVETQYKVCNLTLNYVFIDQYNEPKSPRDIRNSIETYLRLFFKKEEALTWYKMFPYSRLSVSSLIKRSLKNELATGELGRAMKLELVNLFIHENTESFIDNARILFGFSEKFYNHAKEVVVYKQIIEYIKQKPKYDSIHKAKKCNIVDIKPIFYRFCESYLERDLYNYENIYMENLGASCLNQMELVKAAFENEEPKIKPYANPLTKMAEITDFMADSAVLSFKKMSEIEFQRKFLFE